MSYILGDDMSDELGNAPGERAFESGMDDNSVNSNASLGQSSARSADTNGSSHFTLASNAAASSSWKANLILSEIYVVPSRQRSA